MRKTDVVNFFTQTRISTYASTDPEKLNDDQKRTLKTLPTLEAIQKELGEVKKAVEVQCRLHVILLSGEIDKGWF